MDAKREKTRKFLAGAKKMQQKTNARKPTPDVKQGWASRAEKHATQAQRGKITVVLLSVGKLENKAAETTKLVLGTENLGCV